MDGKRRGKLIVTMPSIQLMVWSQEVVTIRPLLDKRMLVIASSLGVEAWIHAGDLHIKTARISAAHISLGVTNDNLVRINDATIEFTLDDIAKKLPTERRLILEVPIGVQRVTLKEAPDFIIDPRLEACEIVDDRA